MHVTDVNTTHFTIENQHNSALGLNVLVLDGLTDGACVCTVHVCVRVCHALWRHDVRGPPDAGPLQVERTPVTAPELAGTGPTYQPTHNLHTPPPRTRRHDIHPASAQLRQQRCLQHHRLPGAVPAPLLPLAAAVVTRAGRVRGGAGGGGPRGWRASRLGASAGYWGSEGAWLGC